MSLQSDGRGKYVGRFDKKKVRRVTRGTLALLAILLFSVRFGSELLKLYAYANVLLSGSRMQVYEDVDSVDFTRPAPDGQDSVSDVVVWDDGTRVEYNGHVYELNRNLSTVLVLGIDRKNLQETTTAGHGGQSDVVLLVGLDKETGEATILNISREAYAQVQVYSVEGDVLDTKFEQLTLAYAYGDGAKTSCENAVRSVSYLLYMLPISSYLALDMDGVSAANEIVGGVTVESMFSGTMPDGSVVEEGDRIELHGQNLDRYIRARGAGLESNENRMARQIQYITEFSKKVISRSKDDITFPVDIFSSLSPYIVTNLSVSDVTFLSSCFLKNGSSFRFRSIKGTYDLLNGSAVCYLDEQDLFEAVLQVFYKQVE
jgi:anionic cell wall polymer biosynthesis LytR-Cps2A-Psr (LCP) family protein